MMVREGAHLAAGQIVRTAETDALEVGGARVGLLANAEDTLGAISLVEYAAPPGFPGPPVAKSHNQSGLIHLCGNARQRFKHLADHFRTDFFDRPVDFQPRRPGVPSSAELLGEFCYIDDAFASQTDTRRRGAAGVPPAPAAAPSKGGFENLEDEMASLLGRPKNPS